MDCEMIHAKQDSDQWSALRRCRITASRMGDVMAKPTTKRYQQYQQQLVMELAGKIYVDEKEIWFAHGKFMEPRAIGAAEWKYGWKIEHAIFLISHKHDWLGCSPDGLFNNYTEGVEFKCRSVYQQYLNAREKGVEPAHRFQIQIAIWLTGFDSWWACNYYEHKNTGIRKLSRILVPRDDALIEQMEARCIIFMDEVYKLAGLK